MAPTVDRFCTACGAPLDAQAAFCTACGQPAASATPGPTPEPPGPMAGAPSPVSAPGGERTLAVIGNLTRVGGFMGMKQKMCSLVITDRRLIFAETTKEKMMAAVNEARDAAKDKGKGFLGQWGAQLGASHNYHEAYGQMAPEAILAETPGNFSVDRSAVQGVKFKIGVSDSNGRMDPDHIVIKTTAEKYKLQIVGSLSSIKDRFREAGLI